MMRYQTVKNNLGLANFRNNIAKISKDNFKDDFMDNFTENLTLIGMREDSFFPLSFLNQI